MFRNGAVIPIFALVLSGLLFAAAYAVGSTQATGGAHVFAVPSTGQIGLMTFSLLAWLYGIIGLVSVWLEHTELRPGRRPARCSVAATSVALGLVVTLVVSSGMFVRLVAIGVVKGHWAPALEGITSGAMFAIAAALLAVFRKGFVAEEVVTEAQH